MAQFTNHDFDRLDNEPNRAGICILRSALDPRLVAEWREAFNRLYAERQARPRCPALRG